MLQRDLRTLLRFVELYCRCRHGTARRAPLRLKFFDVAALGGSPCHVCLSCTRLLGHAFLKRLGCPYNPKPSCRKCPTHCYAPRYRAEIRAVMRYSGRRLVLTGRLDYLFHLLF